MSGWENPTPVAPSVATILAAVGAPAPGAHTGDLLETLLTAAIAIPANALGANGRLEIRTLWTQAGAGATAPTLRARIGAPGSGLAGTIVASLIAGAVGVQAGEQVWDIYNGGVTNAQEGPSSTSQNIQTVNGNGILLSPAIDTTQTLELNISGQLATAGNTITLRALWAILWPHA